MTISSYAIPYIIKDAAVSRLIEIAFKVTTVAEETFTPAFAAYTIINTAANFRAAVTLVIVTLAADTVAVSNITSYRNVLNTSLSASLVKTPNIEVKQYSKAVLIDAIRSPADLTVGFALAEAQYTTQTSTS